MIAKFAHIVQAFVGGLNRTITEKVSEMAPDSSVKIKKLKFDIKDTDVKKMISRC